MRTTSLKVGSRQAKNYSPFECRRKALPKAAASTMSRMAFRARKELQAQMPDIFEGGVTKQVLNSVRVIQAKPNNNLDNIEATVHLTDWSSEILSPSIFGGTITSLHGQNDILTPILSSFEHPLVRRVLGNVIDDFGNVRRLRRGVQIARILAQSTHVFEIDNPAHPWLSRGIYFRINEEDIVTLFTVEESAEREEIFDFFGIAASVFDNVAPVFAEEYQKEIDNCR